MAQTPPLPPVEDGMMSNILEAIRTSRADALAGWWRGCDLCSRYFTDLAQAYGPDGLYAANAWLLEGGMDAFTQALSAVPRAGGVSRSPGRP